MDFIQKYFAAERAESFVFLGIGLAALAAAAWFFFAKNDALLRGAAWPLALVALIQITVGYAVMVRSPKDSERVQHIVRHEPLRLQSEEIPRMEAVMRNFAIYRWTEIALLAVGIALFFAAGTGFWRGVGIGLAAQAALMLLADGFAEARGHAYLAELKKLI